VALVEESRKEVLELAGFCDPNPPCVCIVIVARGPLRVPQLSSPVMLPGWFPAIGGQTVTCLIQDLWAVASVPCNAPEVKIGELCSLCFEVEGELLECISRHHAAERRDSDRLHQSFRDCDLAGGSMASFLELVATGRSRILDPSSYCPSARAGDSILAWVLRYVGRSSPEKLHKGGRALWEAVGGSNAACAPPQVPLVTLFPRPTTQIAADIAWARNMLVALYAASQLTTAAAHADSYGRYPVQLLRSASHDLRQFLSDTAGWLALHTSDIGPSEPS
jgi:hypothetical protein